MTHIVPVRAKTETMECVWCLGTFEYLHRGGKPRKYRSSSCRHAAHSSRYHRRLAGEDVPTGDTSVPALYVGAPIRLYPSAAQQQKGQQ